MAGSENLVVLIGRLGGDPEIRGTQDGRSVANLRMATTESWNDKRTGQRSEKTDWHTVVLFGGHADVARQYLKKGANVYIRGSLRYNEWEDQNGNKRRDAQVVAQSLSMLDGKSNGASTEYNEAKRQPIENRNSAPQRGQNSPQPGRSSMAARQLQAAKWDELDDEIPFE